MHSSRSSSAMQKLCIYWSRASGYVHINRQKEKKKTSEWDNEREMGRLVGAARINMVTYVIPLLTAVNGKIFLHKTPPCFMNNMSHKEDIQTFKAYHLSGKSDLITRRYQIDSWLKRTGLVWCLLWAEVAHVKAGRVYLYSTFHTLK